MQINLLNPPQITLTRTSDPAVETAEIAERDLETIEIESVDETLDPDLEIEEIETEIDLAEDLLLLCMELASDPIRAGVLAVADHRTLMFALPME
jgi:hypothetical protein